MSKIEKIETALEPGFQQLFIDAMALPNKVDPFPKLSAEVKLPERKVLAEGEGGDGSPRRRSREERAARRVARTDCPSDPAAGAAVEFEGRADVVGGGLDGRGRVRRDEHRKAVGADLRQAILA